MAYFIGNQEVTEDYWKQHNAAATSQQVGSQFWMQSGYQGAEPPIEVKKAFSSADYGRDWITGYANTLVGAGVPVSEAIQAITKNPITTNPGQMWESNPITSPVVAAAQRWPAFVAARPEAFNNPTSAFAPGSPVSGAGAGSVDPWQVPTAVKINGPMTNPLTGGDGAGTSSGGSSSYTTTTDDSGASILSSLLSLPVLLIAVAFIILAYLATSARGHGASA